MDWLQSSSPFLLAIAAIIGAISGLYGVIKGNRARLEESNKSAMKSTIDAVNILMREKDKFYVSQINELQKQITDLRTDLINERQQASQTVEDLQGQVTTLIREGREKDVIIGKQNSQIIDLRNKLEAVERRQAKEKK